MSIQVGQRLPEGTFTRMTASGPAPVTAAEVFGGKHVVLFAVPGAFTPTCSKQHLPSYLRNYDAIKAKGVDTIACMAVNDVFVLDAWNKANDIGDRILLLSDGNGDYTKKLGLEMDASKYGMGHRAQRFSMVVDDGVVKELNVEPGPGVSVSGAEATCKL